MSLQTRWYTWRYLVYAPAFPDYAYIWLLIRSTISSCPFSCPTRWDIISSNTSPPSIYISQLHRSHSRLSFIPHETPRISYRTEIQIGNMISTDNIDGQCIQKVDSRALPIKNYIIQWLNEKLNCTSVSCRHSLLTPAYLTGAHRCSSSPSPVS